MSGEEKKKSAVLKVDRTPELVTDLMERLEKVKGEKKVLADELDDKKTILATQALEAFETEKKALLELCKTSNLSDEKIEEINNMLDEPKKLETTKNVINLLLAGIPKEGDDAGGKKKPTSGKAPIKVPENAKKYTDQSELVDKLYDIAYYNPDVTPEERADAKKKVNILVEAMITGKSWKSLRDGKHYPTGIISECPRCHRMYVGEIPEKCEKCKYNLRSVRGDL